MAITFSISLLSTFLGDSSVDVIFLVESLHLSIVSVCSDPCVLIKKIKKPCVLAALLLLFEFVVTCIFFESIVTCLQLTEQLRHRR